MNKPVELTPIVTVVSSKKIKKKAKRRRKEEHREIKASLERLSEKQRKHLARAVYEIERFREVSRTATRPATRAEIDDRLALLR